MKAPITVHYKDFVITTNKTLLNPHDAHQWLSEVSYWAKGMSFDLFKTSYDNSFCIGALHGDKQIAFARLITDYAIFGYLADVYVTEEYRGQGISKFMLQQLMSLDWVSQLRSIKLMTSDAQGLYRQFGFRPPKFPERLMERRPENLMP